jgi:hypothetical protein
MLQGKVNRVGGGGAGGKHHAKSKQGEIQGQWHEQQDNMPGLDRFANIWDSNACIDGSSRSVYGSGTGAATGLGAAMGGMESALSHETGNKRKNKWSDRWDEEPRGWGMTEFKGRSEPANDHGSDIAVAVEKQVNQSDVEAVEKMGAEKRIDKVQEETEDEEVGMAMTVKKKKKKQKKKKRKRQDDEGGDGHDDGNGTEEKIKNDPLETRTKGQKKKKRDYAEVEGNNVSHDGTVKVNKIKKLHREETDTIDCDESALPQPMEQMKNTKKTPKNGSRYHDQCTSYNTITAAAASERRTSTESSKITRKQKRQDQQQQPPQQQQASAPPERSTRKIPVIVSASSLKPKTSTSSLQSSSSSSSSRQHSAPSLSSKSTAPKSTRTSATNITPSSTSTKSYFRPKSASRTASTASSSSTQRKTSSTFNNTMSNTYSTTTTSSNNSTSHNPGLSHPSRPPPPPQRQRREKQNSESQYTNSNPYASIIIDDDDLAIVFDKVNNSPNSKSNRAITANNKVDSNCRRNINKSGNDNDNNNDIWSTERVIATVDLTLDSSDDDNKDDNKRWSSSDTPSKLTAATPTVACAAFAGYKSEETVTRSPEKIDISISAITEHEGSRPKYEDQFNATREDTNKTEEEENDADGDGDDDDVDLGMEVSRGEKCEMDIADWNAMVRSASVQQAEGESAEHDAEGDVYDEMDAVDLQLIFNESHEKSVQEDLKPEREHFTEQGDRVTAAVTPTVEINDNSIFDDAVALETEGALAAESSMEQNEVVDSDGIVTASEQCIESRAECVDEVKVVSGLVSKGISPPQSAEQSGILHTTTVAERETMNEYDDAFLEDVENDENEDEEGLAADEVESNFSELDLSMTAREVEFDIDMSGLDDVELDEDIDDNLDVDDYGGDVHGDMDEFESGMKALEGTVEDLEDGAVDETDDNKNLKVDVEIQEAVDCRAVHPNERDEGNEQEETASCDSVTSTACTIEVVIDEDDSSNFDQNDILDDDIEAEESMLMETTADLDKVAETEIFTHDLDDVNATFERSSTPSFDQLETLQPDSSSVADESSSSPDLSNGTSIIGRKPRLPPVESAISAIHPRSSRRRVDDPNSLPRDDPLVRLILQPALTKKDPRKPKPPYDPYKMDCAVPELLTDVISRQAFIDSLEPSEPLQIIDRYKQPFDFSTSTCDAFIEDMSSSYEYLPRGLVLPPVAWPPAELNALNYGLENHGKNFTLISRISVPTRTTHECIEAYYTLKHSLRYWRVRNQKKVSKKNSCSGGFRYLGKGNGRAHRLALLDEKSLVEEWVEEQKKERKWNAPSSKNGNDRREEADEEDVSDGSDEDVDERSDEEGISEEKEDDEEQEEIQQKPSVITRRMRRAYEDDGHLLM